MDETFTKTNVIRSVVRCTRRAGVQKWRFKDTLRHNLQNVGIEYNIGNDSMRPFKVEKYIIAVFALERAHQKQIVNNC